MAYWSLLPILRRLPGGEVVEEGRFCDQSDQADRGHSTKCLLYAPKSNEAKS